MAAELQHRVPTAVTWSTLTLQVQMVRPQSALAVAEMHEATFKDLHYGDDYNLDVEEAKRMMEEEAVLLGCKEEGDKEKEGAAANPEPQPKRTRKRWQEKQVRPQPCLLFLFCLKEREDLKS